MKTTTAFLFFAAVFCFVVSDLDSRDRPIEREVFLMGTTLRATLFASDRRQGIAELERVFAEIDSAEKQLSTWLAESDVSLLNKQATGRALAVSPSIFNLMQKLQSLSRESDGYFDPAIGQLTAAWKVHDGFAIPNAEHVNHAIARSGMRHFVLNNADRTITRNAAVLLDVGGFGKGVGLDRGMQAARERNVGALMLDFGGHLSVHGAPPGEQGWPVKIADAKDRALPSPVSVRIESGSLSTSGGSERDGFQQGRRISHILNPRTGYPADSFGSVTVWHERALEADAFSTALYAMGPDKGFGYATEKRIAACFLVTSANGTTVKMTPEFQKLTVEAQTR